MDGNHCRGVVINIKNTCCRHLMTIHVDMVVNNGHSQTFLSGKMHPQKKKISWCVSSQPHNFLVFTQGHGLIEQVKVNFDLTKHLYV